MRGPIAYLLSATVALLGATGCSNNDTAVAVVPAPVLTTETFTGTLTTNGAFSYPFIVIGAGAISAQLTTLTPDSTKPIGLALGTWNGNACQIVLSNDTSILSSAVTGRSTVSGSFCVRVYDAAGTVTSQESYVVEVVHP